MALQKRKNSFFRFWKRRKSILEQWPIRSLF